MRLLLSLFLVAGYISAQPYQPVLLEQIAGGAAPEYVRVWGHFHPDRQSRALVSGQLGDGTHSLRIEGTVFDWRPQRGQMVEMWGQLERTTTGNRLRFHNGRSLHEARHPRPTPVLQEGAEVSLWLKVTETGSQPYPMRQGTAEDRRVFFLQGYEGRPGLVCVSGSLAFLERPIGSQAVLREAKECDVGNVP